MKKKTTAPALDKGIRILETLAQTHEPMTMTQIASELDLTVSSIQRILGELVEQGYVGRTGTNGYYLTDRFFKLAAARDTEESLLYHSMEAMHGYVMQTTESVHLSIARAGQFVVIGQVNGINIVRVSIREGSYPLAGFPSGWTLLAYGAEEALLDESLSVEGQRRIEEARERGFAFAESDSCSGIFHLSVPVCSAEKRAVGALGSTFALHRKGQRAAEEQKEELLPALLKAAGQIEKNLSPGSPSAG